MKRIMSILAIGSLALGSVITFGVGSASAATTTPTVVLSGAKGTFPGSTPPLVATTSVAGAVTFTVGGATISGCSAVATTTVTPFVATCTWSPTAAGPVVFGASFVPTDTTDYANATATAYDVTIAPPIQGLTGGAGNGGPVNPPATCYNGIGVGDAYGGGSSVGPTLDNGRCKPDIMAPAGETSYSTPQVAGGRRWC